MTSKPSLNRLTSITLAISAALFFVACGSPKETTVTTDDGRVLQKVILQTDWYAQPEHGGFYEAMLSGMYEEAGLAVEIAQGGPGAAGLEKLLTGRVDISIGRTDDIITYISEGKPFVIVGVFMQHDPQAIMLHASNPVNDFADLEGVTVMAIPGSNWLKGIEQKFNIQIPQMAHDYGMERFLADPNYIQQCFITNEPYYVRKQGVEVKTLLISDSGFDPYRIIFSTQQFVQENPETVKAFVDASIKGWSQYMETSPEDPTNQHIIGLNIKLDEEFVAYSMNTMKEMQLISGDPDEGDYVGKLDPARVQASIDDLAQIGALEKDLTLNEVLWMP